MLSRIFPIFFLACLGLFFTACDAEVDNAAEAELRGADDAGETMVVKAQDATYMGMMKVHDAVMPQMGRMNALKRDIEAKMDDNSLSAAPKNAGRQLAEKLDNADEKMKAWMANNQTLEEMRAAGMTSEQIDAALAERKREVDAIAADMRNTMREAQNYMESLTEVTGS